MDKNDRSRSFEKREAWERALYTPSSIAIVWASRDPKKWGFHILFNTRRIPKKDVLVKVKYHSRTTTKPQRAQRSASILKTKH